MNFDPVAFALGPQGVAVATQGNSDGGGGASVAAAVVSSLIGEDTVTVEPLSVTANGTYTAPTGKAYSPVTVNVSGGTKTLQNSGWVQSYEDYVEMDGNTITFKAGSTSHSLYIAPPSVVRGNTRFLPEDVLIIAFTVKELNNRFSMNMANASNWTTESETELMTVSTGNAYTKSTGSDILTYTFSAASSYSGNLVLAPKKASDGSTLASASATIEITGMSFNGNLIFGSVTPPSA